MDKQIRYLPDETGKNQDNLVRKEPHHLPIAVRGRVIVPDHGSFFRESVVVRDRLTGRKLIPKRDYVCAGLRVAQTRVADGGVYAIILVTDDECSNLVEIDYQVYGNDMFQFVEPTIELLQESFESNDGIPMAKLLKLPREWKPTFHYHDLGNIDKFDFLLFSLDKIRNSLLANNPAVFKYLLDFEKMMNMLMARANTEFEGLLFSKMREFTENFGKRIFGLEKVSNYPLMVPGDGTAIAKQEMFPEVIESKEAYLNMEALSEFSKQLWTIYVNLPDSGIGAYTEYNVEASTAEFEAMPIGAIFTINDYNFAEIAKNPEIETFYPDRLDRVNGYAIRKITSSNSKFGSMFLYTGRSNSKTYIMRLIQSADGKKSSFRYIANSMDQPGYLDDIVAHIDDRMNPHMDDKRDIDKAQVENLPIASKEDLFCNMPVRKYLTVESILHYMKRFKTGKKDTSEIFTNLSERSVRKQMQTIFSPCGAWDDNIDVDKIELCRVIEVPTTLPPLEPVWTVTPDKTAITIEMVDEDDITTTTTTTTTTQAPTQPFKALHYGEFINSDGTFFFSLVSKDTPNGTPLFLQLKLAPKYDDEKIISLGERNYLAKSIINVIPPHTVAGGSHLDFTDDYYEIQLIVRRANATGPVLAESEWIKCYNLKPKLVFDLFSIRLIGKHEEGLCTTTQFDGYFDPKWDTPDEAYRQWLGYQKSGQLLEFGAWKSTSNTPQPGKIDVYMNEYFNERGPTNYKKTHIDPDTGKPRPMELNFSGFWFADDGVTIPGAPWVHAKPFENFDLKIEYAFYKNGQLNPQIIEQYYYCTKETNDFGLPAEKQPSLVGAHMAKLVITHDKLIDIQPGNKLVSPPQSWLEDINK